jgi:hypothetical protein
MPPPIVPVGAPCMPLDIDIIRWAACAASAPQVNVRIQTDAAASARREGVLLVDRMARLKILSPIMSPPRRPDYGRIA